MGKCAKKVNTEGRACSCEPLGWCTACDQVLGEGGEVIGNVCELCNSGKYLLDGLCVSACPETHIPTGNGTYGRECVPTFDTVDAAVNATVFECIGATSPTCSCRLLPDCFACLSVQLADYAEPLPLTCTMCKNSQFLVNGTCVAACPEGLYPQGTGTYGLTCVSILQTDCGESFIFFLFFPWVE